MAEELLNTIKIGKKETTMNLGGHNPDVVNYLRVYADNKTANPDFLSDVFCVWSIWRRLI